MKKTILYTILALVGVCTMKAQCLTKLDSGNYFNYGLKPNGTLWNWGSGAAFGQLGDGMEADHHVPTQLTTATNWQSFTCGTYYVLAIKANGTLWAAGDNSTGQLGIGSSAIYSNTLIQVGTATNWKQVGTGDFFNIAVKTDGTLWGWGQNHQSQMGDGSCCADRLSPGQIGTATNWKMAAAAGAGTGMAIKTNGTLWGWGNNNISGLLGPSTLSGVQTPTQIGTDTDWETMSLGIAYILALKTDGSLWSWGGGGYGENGDTLPPTYFRDAPVHIGTFTWLKVAAGFRSSYGIRSDGTLWAWGLNDAGQLGDGTTTNRMQPVQIGTNRYRY
ncbi:RCC1 domain-containing protein [Flavobacterium sp.]|uniref:RCC1 domain-containing protein n=1 Tax=Flavobacterium sp. TaxID=239 RepID=UPI0025EEFCEF|nr:RCC1 domain-containing protein [Flavobacterium sp.]